MVGISFFFRLSWTNALNAHHIWTLIQITRYVFILYKKAYINVPVTVQGNKNSNLSFLTLRQFTFFFVFRSPTISL